MPVAAVAVIGIAAATSTPHSNADDVGGPPVPTAATADNSASQAQPSQSAPTDAQPAQ